MKFIAMMYILFSALSALTCEAAENGFAPGTGPFRLDGQSYFDLPPPGLYLLNYTGYFSANKIANDKGHDALPGAKVKTKFNTFRFSYFLEKPIWGAQWQVYEIIPTLSESEFSFNGKNETKSGIADMAINPFGLGWNIGNSNIGFSTAFIAPIGRYDQDDPVNLGSNHFTWIPQILYTYYLPNGWGDFSAHMGYEYNWINRKGLKTVYNPDGSDYRNGQAIHAEAALTHYIGNWRVGANVVAGYQTSSDKISGDAASDEYLQEELNGNRYEKVSLGISTQYRIGGVAPLTVTYNKDVIARNTAEGDSIVIRVVLPFSAF